MSESSLSTAVGLIVGTQPAQKWPTRFWLSALFSEHGIFGLPNSDHFG